MKKINIFAGHYGSGKTNLSVNYALMLKEEHEDVIVCDIDTVNPYFRTKDSKEVFDRNGIRLIAPEFANSNLDIPSISAAVNKAFDDPGTYSVFDVGGDDAGAVALGQFADKIQNSEYEMFLVVNKYRPLTKKPVDVVEYKNDIEAVCHIKFTGIINNSNVGEDTSAEYVLASDEYAQEVSKLTGLPLVYTSVTPDIYDDVKDALSSALKINIYKKTAWKV